MTTKEKIAVMQAFEDGKPIQIANINFEDWSDMNIAEPVWNWQLMKYRIKPEPKLRPYKNAEEFLQAWEEHGKWIRSKKGEYYMVERLFNDLLRINDSFMNYVDLMTDFVWQDGTPCGIMEE